MCRELWFEICFDKSHVGLCTMIILTIVLMIVIAAARMTRLCTLNIVSGFCAVAQRFRFPWTRGMLTICLLFSELQIIMSSNFSHF